MTPKVRDATRVGDSHDPFHSRKRTDPHSEGFWTNFRRGRAAGGTRALPQVNDAMGVSHPPAPPLVYQRTDTLLGENWMAFLVRGEPPEACPWSPE